MASCKSCGVEISGNYPFCSICYGDPAYGDDGYYAELLRQEQERDEQRQEQEREQENES